MAKEKKQFKELSDEELNQVNGGNNPILLQKNLEELSSKKYDAIGECIENVQMTISSILKKDLL